MKIKFTLLMDDKPGAGLLNEHGLSIHIDAGEYKMLFDTGQSGRFAENAERLGVDLESIDFALVSHGHYDHGDGLQTFFDRNNDAQVYIHSKSIMPIYYSRRSGSDDRYVGINHKTITANIKRFNLLESSTTPAAGVYIIPCTDVEGRGPIFKDKGLFLKLDDIKSFENFDHEIFMVIERDSDFIVISGCSHNNILAIIKHSRQLFPTKKLSNVIGGFHMPDIKAYTDEHIAAVQATADELLNILAECGNDSSKSGPLFRTGHCTGDKAKAILKAKLGDNIEFFHSGYNFLL